MADYTIASGDTMSGIAKKFGVSMKDLLAANSLTDPNVVKVGQKIKVPVPVAAPTTGPTPGSGTFPPLTVAPQAGPPTTIDDGSPRTSIVTITVIVTIPRTTVKP